MAQRAAPDAPPPAAMAAFPRHRRFLGGFVCGAAAGAAASCWAAWRLLRSQSQAEPGPSPVLLEGKSRGLRGGRARRRRGSAEWKPQGLSAALVLTAAPVSKLAPSPQRGFLPAADIPKVPGGPGAPLVRASGWGGRGKVISGCWAVT